MIADHPTRGSGYVTTPDKLIFRCTGTYDGMLDSDLVIFSAVGRRLHVLNVTARQTWMNIESGVTGDRLVASLATEYGVDPGEITGDIMSLVDRFVDMGICHLEHSCAHRSQLLHDARGQKSVGDVALIGLVDSDPIDSIRALGIPVVIETNDGLLRTELTRVFDPLKCDDVDLLNSADADRFQHIVINAADNVWNVQRNSNSVVAVSSRYSAIRSVVAECNTAPLHHIDDAVVFHAAVADLGRGNLLMPGVSKAGKSTLVAQLALRGHAYVTDEAAAVDVRSLSVRPFTKSICIEEGTHRQFPELAPPSTRTLTDSSWDVDPRCLGPGLLGGGGPISAVVFPTYDADADPVLRPLDKLDSLRRLIANAFVFDEVGEAAFDAIVEMVTVLPIYELVHKGGTTHLDQLEDMFGNGNAVSL